MFSSCTSTWLYPGIALAVIATIIELKASRQETTEVHIKKWQLTEPLAMGVFFFWLVSLYLMDVIPFFSPEDIKWVIPVMFFSLVLTFIGSSFEAATVFNLDLDVVIKRVGEQLTKAGLDWENGSKPGQKISWWKTPQYRNQKIEYSFHVLPRGPYVHLTTSAGMRDEQLWTNIIVSMGGKEEQVDSTLKELFPSLKNEKPSLKARTVFRANVPSLIVGKVLLVASVGLILFACLG